MAECIRFENSFQRLLYTYEFQSKEWTIKEVWRVDPSIIQKLILIKDDYFESYYYVDLEIDSAFKNCNTKIIKSIRAASNNIQFVINGDEYSCFEEYPKIDEIAQEHKHQYKITLAPILQFTNEIFRKPGKRTKIDLLEGLKKLSNDISSLKDAEYYDIILCCGVKKVKVHKNILSARSEMFNKFLHGAEEEEIKKCLKIEHKIASDSNCSNDDHGDNDSDLTTKLTEKNKDVENGPEMKNVINAAAMFTKERKEDQNGFEKEIEFNNNAESPGMSTEKSTAIQNGSKPNKDNDDDYSHNRRTAMKSEKQKEVQNDSEIRISDDDVGAERDQFQTFIRAETHFKNNVCSLTTATDEKKKTHDILEIKKRTFNELKNNDRVSATYKEDSELKSEIYDDHDKECDIGGDYDKECDIGDDYDKECDIGDDYDKECDIGDDYDKECDNGEDCDKECDISDYDTTLSAEGYVNQNGSPIKLDDNTEVVQIEEGKKEQNSTEAVSNSNTDNLIKRTGKEKKIQNGLKIKQESFNDIECNDGDILDTLTENERNQNGSQTDMKSLSTTDSLDEDPSIIEVRLKNICSSVFDDFIDFIYSGQYKTFDIQKAKDLLIAARIYGIHDLENKCILYLKRQISMGTCDDIYNFASQIECEKLQIYVLDYIKNRIIERRQRNIDFILMPEEEKMRWMRIMKNHAAYLSDILKMKKNKKIRDVLVTIDCAECLEDILDSCISNLNNAED